MRPIMMRWTRWTSSKGTEFETEAVLSDRQREMVLAGGLLNYTREQSK